jgi:hypothetical protein
LLHLLPNGFHRIRRYGFLANSHRATKLAQCRCAVSYTGNVLRKKSEIAAP